MRSKSVRINTQSLHINCIKHTTRMVYMPCVEILSELRKDQSWVFWVQTVLVKVVPSECFPWIYKYHRVKQKF